MELDTKTWKSNCEKEFLNILKMYHDLTENMIQVKTSVHKLEQLGIDTSYYNEIIEYIGIYLYKLDMCNLDKSVEVDEIEDDL